MPLQIRRGTEAERQAMTIPLAVGEPLYVTDTGSIWVGDGVSPGGVQVTGLTLEDAVDSVAAALVAGVNQNITFVYGTAQDQANRIDAVLDLSTVDGVITADGFKGSVLADDSGVIINSSNRNVSANDISANDISANDISANDISANDISANDITINNLTLSGDILTPGAIIADLKGSVIADDSTVLVDSIDGTINLSGTINADVVPNLDGSIDLGTSAIRFRNLFLRSGGLYLDDALITGSPSGTVDLPSGSTIGGIPISSGIPIINDGIVEGSNYNINIVADDSSFLVNASTKTITGNLVGLSLSSPSAIINANLTLSDISIELEQGNTLTLGSKQLLSGEDNFELKVLGGATFEGVSIGSLPSFTLNIDSIIEDSGGDPVPFLPGDFIGGVRFAAFDAINTFVTKAFVASRIDSATDNNPLPGRIDFILETAPSNFDTSASITARGTVEASAFVAKAFTDTAARDAALTDSIQLTPAPGTIVFVTDIGGGTPKFQGWTGSVWVDLH
jgi:hypothetical protein